MSGWNRVTKAEPCPICSLHDKACSVAKDGSAVCCMKIPSDKECKGQMGGWIHRTGVVRFVRKFLHKPRPAVERKGPKYWQKILEQSHKELLTMYPLIEQLGVSTESLCALFTGWLEDHKAFTFPMWTPGGELCGFRLRNWEGKKWSLPGSKNGLFWPGSVGRDVSDALMITEGPTDCAAALDMEFKAIGKFSALGGRDQVVEFCSYSWRKAVVIVADNDSKDNVGMRGALALASDLRGLCEVVRVIRPPLEFKDLREWYFAGARRDDILGLL